MPIEQTRAILPVAVGQCPNPWCVSTTRPMPAFSSRSETWRVVCACGVRSLGAETEAEAVEVWNAATDPNGLPARVEKLIAERTLDGYLASEVARMVQGCQSHSLPGDVVTPIERTAEQERAAIVAWLRDEAQLCDCFAREEGECACGAWDSEPGERSYKRAYIEDIADAIERGDHIEHSGYAETNNG